MILLKFKTLILGVIVAMLLSACQTIVPQSAMPKGIATPAPAAFQDLCRRNPEECVLPYSTDFEKELTTLQQDVRDLVIPTQEEGDLWQTLAYRGPGDCEDFALTLRQRLRRTMPEFSGAFLIATAYTEEAQYHAVLTIETSGGTIVCDIRYPQCAPWKSFPYEWHLREIAGAKNWENIGHINQLAVMGSASTHRKNP